MKRFLTWLKRTLPSATPTADASLRQSGMRMSPTLSAKRPIAKPKTSRNGSKGRAAAVKFSSESVGRIVDGGPGKNILIRNRYVREDTGTHDNLRIVDDSVLNSDDEDGIDPYNTGQFDRSKTWDRRSRK